MLPMVDLVTKNSYIHVLHELADPLLYRDLVVESILESKSYTTMQK